MAAVSWMQMLIHVLLATSTLLALPKVSLAQVCDKDKYPRKDCGEIESHSL